MAHHKDRNCWIHVDVLYIKKETASAFLLVIENPDANEVWIPKSAIECPEAHEEGDRDCVVNIAQWLVEKENLIDIDS